MVLAVWLAAVVTDDGDVDRAAPSGRAPDATAPSSTTGGDAPSSSTTEAEGSPPPVVTVPEPDGGWADPAVDDVVDPTFPGLGDPRVDVVHYDLTVRADMGDPVITGTAVVSLAALTEEPLDRFTLDLDGPVATSVSIDGAPAGFSADGEELEVVPAEPLRPLEVVAVEIAYSGTPAPEYFDGLGALIGWQPDSEGGWFTISEPDGTSTWAPVDDHPSDEATWRVALDTPAGITGVSNGRLVEDRPLGDRHRWVWEQDRPMATYAALVAVGRYELVSHDRPDGVQVTFAFPSSLPVAARAGFDRYDEVLSYFASQFGPYPDDDAGAVVVPAELSVALETQTRPVFSAGWVTAERVEALAHEIAHEWFGNAVTPVEWTDLWLSEGLATYADLMWQTHDGGVPLVELLDDDQSPLFGSPLPPRSVEAAAGFDAAVYGGGARAIHALRLEVGDDVFGRILRRWVAERSGLSASTDDFLAVASDEAGRDVRPVLEPWLFGGGYHDLPR